MVDMLYIAQADNVEQQLAVLQTATSTLEQNGMIHSNVAGRFEVVQKLPKVADSFDNMFNYADAFGKFRFAYIDSAHKISNTPKETKHALALGGEFGFNTASYYNLSLHISAFVSQNIPAFNPTKDNINEDFFDVNTASFVYLGEASIDYNSDLLSVKIGRVRVDTPYANSDDIRMAPNTFQGAWANFKYTSKLKTQILYFSEWAGYDSQDEEALASQSEFKNLVSENSFGMVGASLTYEYAKNSQISFWYNYIDGMAAIAYAEIVGIYFINGDGFHIDYGFQFSSIGELKNSNVDGDVAGVMSIMHYNGLFVGVSYNAAYSDSGKYITDGFGGGPYYTSLDEATLAAVSQSTATASSTESKNNTEAFRVGTGYEFQKSGIEGLVVELVYGELYNDTQKIKEQDVVLTYDVTDKWHLEAIYTNYSSSGDNNTFDRGLVRIDYSFE